VPLVLQKKEGRGGTHQFICKKRGRVQAKKEMNHPSLWGGPTACASERDEGDGRWHEPLFKGSHAKRRLGKGVNRENTACKSGEKGNVRNGRKGRSEVLARRFVLGGKRKERDANLN